MTVPVSPAPRSKANPHRPSSRRTSADILILPSRIERDCRTNMSALVEHARKLQVFGPDVDFDAPIWDITSTRKLRPTSAQVRKLYFMTRGKGRASEDGREVMARPFGDLIRSIVVLREFARPFGSHTKVVDASKALYEVLRDQNYDPAELTSEHFARAARLLEERMSRTSSYSQAGALVEIAKFLNDRALTKAIISFRNPISREDDIGSRIDDKARSRRAEKMASEEVIDAIIAMASMVTLDTDILRARIVELLFCAPWRINEVLNLSVDCIRTEKATSNGEPILDDSGQQVENFGIAYGGSKGYPDSVKWIPTAMVDVAKKAIADITRITQPARDVAKWMAQHPGRAFLPPPWRLADPETEVWSRDLPNLLGVSNFNAGRLTLHTWRVEPKERRKLPGQPGIPQCVYRLGDIEQKLLELQPKLPADAPRPLEEYLLLLPLHFFHPVRNSFESIVTIFSDRHMRTFLTGSGYVKSVFERLDLRDEQGKPYNLRSHAVRHYLNTLAQEGGVSQLDIARWSGRKNLHQNSVYDHMSGMALAETTREVLKTGAVMGSVAETFKRLPPVERDEFLKARFATAHTTDLGMCFQDWTLAPCHKHGGCADCGEHLIIKGDSKHIARTQQMLQEQKAMLAEAEKEVSEETYGASNYVDHNRKIVAGLEKALAVHNDPDIPDGTLVQVGDEPKEDEPSKG